MGSYRTNNVQTQAIQRGDVSVEMLQSIHSSANKDTRRVVMLSSLSTSVRKLQGNYNIQISDVENTPAHF
jgi:hypothetical protein